MFTGRNSSNVAVSVGATGQLSWSTELHILKLYKENIKQYDASLENWEWEVYFHHSVVQHTS